MRSKTWTNSTGKSPVTRWCDGRGQQNAASREGSRSQASEAGEDGNSLPRMTPERAKLARLGVSLEWVRDRSG